MNIGGFFSRLKKMIHSEKPQKMGMPPRHQDTKVHKALIFKGLNLVQLGALVPWWQKYIFGVDSKDLRIFPVIILILNFWSSIAGQVQDSEKFKSLLPYDFHLAYLKEDKAILIDVREFFEFRGKRITDAVNLPSSGNLELAADTINKECVLFLYCTTDYRSKRVAEFFYDKGFRNLYSLDGGIVAWKKDGFPVEKRKVRRRE